MNSNKNVSGWFHSIIATNQEKVISVTTRDFNDKLAGFLHHFMKAPLSNQRNRIVTNTMTISDKQLVDILEIFDDYQEYKEIEFLKACIVYLRMKKNVNSLTLAFHNS